MYLPDEQTCILLDEEGASRVQGGRTRILDGLGHQVPGRCRALWRDAVKRPAPARLGAPPLPGYQLQSIESLKIERLSASLYSASCSLVARTCLTQHANHNQPAFVRAMSCS
jgi:hypothetical protein